MNSRFFKLRKLSNFFLRGTFSFLGNIFSPQTHDCLNNVEIIVFITFKIILWTPLLVLLFFLVSSLMLGNYKSISFFDLSFVFTFIPFFLKNFKNTNQNTRHLTFFLSFFLFFSFQVSLLLQWLTWLLVGFFFFFLWFSKLQITWFILSFFLSFFFSLIFFSL